MKLNKTIQNDNKSSSVAPAASNVTSRALLEKVVVDVNKENVPAIKRQKRHADNTLSSNLASRPGNLTLQNDTPKKSRKLYEGEEILLYISCPCILAPEGRHDLSLASQFIIMKISTARTVQFLKEQLLYEHNRKLYGQYIAEKGKYEIDIHKSKAKPDEYKGAFGNPLSDESRLYEYDIDSGSVLYCNFHKVTPEIHERGRNQDVALKERPKWMKFPGCNNKGENEDPVKITGEVDGKKVVCNRPLKSRGLKLTPPDRWDLQV